MEPGSLDPVASERLSHAAKSWTSDLSINEFALPVSYTHLTLPTIA